MPSTLDGVAISQAPASCSGCPVTDCACGETVWKAETTRPNIIHFRSPRVRGPSFIYPLTPRNFTWCAHRPSLLLRKAWLLLDDLLPRRPRALADRHALVVVVDATV